MSSILKALRKVEQQKNSRPQYEVDIASGIVREKGVTRVQPWLVAAAMLGVALTATLITYVVMSRQRPLPAAEKAPVVTQVPPQPVVQPAPVVVPPPTPGAEQAPPGPVLPTAGNTIVASPPPVSTPAPLRQPRQLSGATVRQPAAAAPALQPASLPETPAPAPYLPASAPAARTEHAPSSPGTPNLKLSGIAWQKDSASRIAVINGNTVSEGAVVDGARVEEIMPDRVRFSSGQRSFEIPLGKIQN